jgi:hypothetical protein
VNSVHEAEDITSDGDSLLDEILAAIMNDAQAKAAGARAAVIAEYGGKIAYARKFLPRDQAAGAIRACKDAMAAAFALIAKEVATEIATGREAAIRARSKRPRGRKASIWGGPPEKPTPK